MVEAYTKPWPRPGKGRWALVRASRPQARRAYLLASFPNEGRTYFGGRPSRPSWPALASPSLGPAWARHGPPRLGPVGSHRGAGGQGVVQTVEELQSKKVLSDQKFKMVRYYFKAK